MSALKDAHFLGEFFGKRKKTPEGRSSVHMSPGLEREAGKEGDLLLKDAFTVLM